MRKPIFDAARNAKGAGFTQEQVDDLNACLDRMGVPKENPGLMDLTAKCVEFTASEEGLIQEAYKDSVGVWTWALGVTNASGHEVYPRYKDAPQPLQQCVNISVWLMRKTYLPPVLKAFGDYPLQEHELAAALSFHWNTGAIASTNWVSLVKAGKRAEARQSLETHYLNNGTLEERRKREAALFFDAEWPALRVPVYKVSKPSYTPNWSSATWTDLDPLIKTALAS